MASRQSSTRRKPAVTKDILLRYEVDKGHLTRRQMDAIDRLQPPGRMKVKKNLF